jgi:uncharacterized membrane protein
MPNRSSITSRSVYLRAATLGATAGLRSQLPLALLTVAAGRGDFAANATGPLALLRTRTARLACGAAAIGELIADKTPFVPDRIDSAPFAGRLFFGGLTGAVFARGNGASAPLGLALGATAAALGTVAGYRFRTTLDRATRLPDIVWAVTEDLIALSLASLAIRPPRPPIPGGERSAPFRTAPHGTIHRLPRVPSGCLGGRGGRTLLHSPPIGHRLSAIGYRLRKK